MADSWAKIDVNEVPSLTAVTDDANQDIVRLLVDPTTGRLLVSATGLGTGSVTSVSIVTANGISGTVATSTTTPAITLVLGAITPTSVNGLTLASQAVGFTIAGGSTSKTLTVPLDASVSGTNTGDQDLSSLVPKSLYDANTILYATADNTPIPLTVATNNVIGRINGEIVNVPIDSDLTSTSAGDDTVPSAKATKTYADLKIPLAGGTMTGNLTMGDATQVVLTAPTADATCTGFSTSAFNSGYTSSAIGDLVYLDSSATWQKCDAGSTTTSYGLIAIALEVKATGQALKVALHGSFVRLNAWNWTVGNTLYLGETAGAMQNTIPTGADNVIRVVGFAVNADYIYFYPSQDVQTTVA